MEMRSGIYHLTADSALSEPIQHFPIRPNFHSAKMMSGCMITALAITGLTLAAAVQFSCEKSAFIFADSDPQSQEEFSARNPAAGGIIVTQLNNQTSTYHYDNSTKNWVKDPEPLIQCQLDIITDPQMPNCLNISGMPYCETPSNIVQQIRKNMTEQQPSSDRMPIWVDKVCQNPSSAYVRIMFGRYGAHFMAAYQDAQTLQQSPEWSQNVTQMVNKFLTKRSCEAGGRGGSANVTLPQVPGDMAPPPPPGAGNLSGPELSPPSGAAGNLSIR